MTYLRNNGECKAFSLPGSLALYYYIDDGSVRVEDLKQNVQRRYSTNNKTNSTSQGCYVATCVYGSYDCPQVWVLRRFRDYYLDRLVLGKIFIKVYYAISPKIVRIFGTNKLFKLLNKKILDKLVLKLKAKGYKETKYFDKY